MIASKVNHMGIICMLLQKIKIIKIMPLVLQKYLIRRETLQGLNLHLSEIIELCSEFPSTTVILDHVAFCKPPE